uniref:GINS complex subunit 4 n=1 Tax=Naja naja TaxID=35670 RepID=A0A8C6X7I1_NAJNA
MPDVSILTPIQASLGLNRTTSPNPKGAFFFQEATGLSGYIAWMNEKCAPELLESKTEIVECVMEQLEHMEENLKRAKQGDLKISIHRMEVERIRYVLSSYLRCRLRKIEKYFPHILEKEKTRAEGEASILSPEEFAFAKEYMANTENHLKNVALRHMPPNLQKVEFLKAGKEEGQEGPSPSAHEQLDSCR